MHKTKTTMIMCYIILLRILYNEYEQISLKIAVKFIVKEALCVFMWMVNLPFEDNE